MTNLLICQSAASVSPVSPLRKWHPSQVCFVLFSFCCLVGFVFTTPYFEVPISDLVRVGWLVGNNSRHHWHNIVEDYSSPYHGLMLRGGFSFSNISRSQNCLGVYTWHTQRKEHKSSCGRTLGAGTATDRPHFCPFHHLEVSHVGLLYNLPMGLGGK